MAISQYARDHGIAGEDFTQFLTFLMAVDAEHLVMLDERAAQKPEKNPDGQQHRTD